MANCMEEFSTWLGAKLQDLNIDETIFGSYIQGILEGDEPVEEKTEGLQGILSAIIADANEITKLCDEILEKWQLYKSNDPSPTEVGEDLDSKLARLLKSQLPKAPSPKQDEESKDRNLEKKKLKKTILMQYGQMSDDEEGEEGDSSRNSSVPHNAGIAGAGGSDHHKEGRTVLEKNTNAQSVMQAEKEKREQARLDSQKKKEKDKEDREKQKQLRDDKKEKRKTQKQERKR